MDSKREGKMMKGREESDDSDQDQITALTKKIDQIDCLNELTEIVKKLDKNSEISSKEEETPPKKKKYVCLFDSEDSDMKHSKTIFVTGFDCSFPMDVIKRNLREHFSTCGEKVSRVFLPYECKTGSLLGYGFVNMSSYPEKALALNGSYLGGMRLEVTMGRKRDEFYGCYRDRSGCERCRSALMERRTRKFHESFRMRFGKGSFFKEDRDVQAK